MEAVQTRRIEVAPRRLMQDAKSAIHDVYDAIIELITNADDRYQYLLSKGIELRGGKIEIEVERRRRGTPGILRIRDFADGMTADEMNKKLGRIGERVSGLESGLSVRGTNSRGAKDVVALGQVTFESIKGGYYHKCEITPHFDFNSFPSQPVTKELRRVVGIPRGTGTLVTIEVAKTHKIPRHENLRKKIRQLVSLRDILGNRERRIILRDLNQDREDELTPPIIDGVERVKAPFEIPGYPGARAKLIIKRASRPFEREPERFRLGGILIKSRHTIHESTLFDRSLENDPHALRFYGRLVCPYIDELWNAFDDRFESGEEATEDNPCPILDPSRRSGLDRAHPFVKALFREALKRLRRLVEEERKREEEKRAEIESRETRKRLNALEKAAAKFIRDFGADDEPSRDPDSESVESRFKERGYALNPPFAQMIEGHSQRFWFNVHQQSFPEFEVGETVQIECLSSDIESSKRFCGLEPHPTRESVLRAVWTIKALKATSATGLRVRVGSIMAESIIEILETEADKYKDVDTFQFERKRYTVRADAARKKVRLLAPLEMVSQPQEIEISISGKDFAISGDRIMLPDKRKGIAICEIVVKPRGIESKAILHARLADHEASAEILAMPGKGAAIKIKLEDVDHVNQRYRWRQNVLEIAARHPSLRRYLGSKAKGFPGQESKHFRLLIAEIVADAVCAKLVSHNVQKNPEDYEDADWDLYYAEFSKYMTQFLPITHKLQCPEG